MSKTFTVVKQGYQPFPLRLSLSDARDECQNVAFELLVNARRFGHKQATKHKLSRDAYKITMGAAVDSTTYAHVSVIQN